MSKENVLVIGNGGREAALEQAIGASNEVNRVVVSAGFQTGLEAFSGSKNKPFVVIGPEAPLIDGLADHLRSEGYVVLGAGKDAAQYEASKSRTVKLARAAGVVHPATFIAEGRNMKRDARNYPESHHALSYVIKADGPAGGKGVVLPNSLLEARQTVEGMLAGSFEGAGMKIINFAERKKGPEVSVMVLVGKGKNDFMILPLSQDHKRLGDGDTGPNTGGMGAYAPVPPSIVNPAQYEKIEEKVYALLSAMEDEGVLYEGAVLYVALMMSEGLEDNESDLIEINVRFGDPETQVILPLIEHEGVDVYRLLRSTAEGNIERPDVNFANIGHYALTKCLAAKGYPGTPRKGDIIHGLNRAYENVTVQLAGVKLDGENTLTNGGRVLFVTATGKTINQAADSVEVSIGEDAIHFDGMQYRKDIGHQAILAA